MGSIENILQIHSKSDLKTNVKLLVQKCFHLAFGSWEGTLKHIALQL